MKEGQLNREKVPTTDSVGRRLKEPAFRKSDLLSHFVRRPKQGQPIRIGPEETYYLDDDAMVHFKCSRAFLSYYSAMDSTRRPGEKALRTKKFHIIDESKEICRRPLTGRRGEDLEAIISGEERRHPNKGRGLLGKARQKAMRERARAFLEVLKPLLPLKASKVKELANKGAIPLWLMYEQRKGASIDLAVRGRSELLAPARPALADRPDRQRVPDQRRGPRRGRAGERGGGGRNAVEPAERNADGLAE